MKTTKVLKIAYCATLILLILTSVVLAIVMPEKGLAFIVPMAVPILFLTLMGRQVWFGRHRTLNKNKVYFDHSAEKITDSLFLSEEIIEEILQFIRPKLSKEYNSPSVIMEELYKKYHDKPNILLYSFFLFGMITERTYNYIRTNL